MDEEKPSSENPSLEEYDTPERKNCGWSQLMDNSSTIKKECVPPTANASEAKPLFKTPPKRPSKPTVQELERWEREQRDANRKGV
jgi:hypothetical protein